MQWEPSSVYRFNDLLAGLRVMYNNGVANKYFYMGDDSPNGHKYGLVNIAAFLAQSMKETVSSSFAARISFNQWPNPNPDDNSNPNRSSTMHVMKTLGI